MKVGFIGLGIMVGGDEKNFNTCAPIFDTYSSQATLIGDSGSGSICKLANQIIVNNNIAIVAEALTFAAKAGVDPEKVYKAIEGGAARSYALEDKAWKKTTPLTLNILRRWQTPS